VSNLSLAEDNAISGDSGKFTEGQGLTSAAFRYEINEKKSFKFKSSSEKINFNSIEIYSSNEGRGGGDLCEDKIKIIRDDIKGWILRDGSRYLKLPENITYKQYFETMLSRITKTKISCVYKGDKGHPVEIYGTPKICVFSKKNSSITCDAKKFNSLSQEEQFILVHHEYAGLSGVEPPNKEDSNYIVSNQISDYLTSKVVKRLAVKEVKSADDEISELIKEAFSYLPNHPKKNILTDDNFINNLKENIHLEYRSYPAQLNCETPISQDGYISLIAENLLDLPFMRFLLEPSLRKYTGTEWYLLEGERPAIIVQIPLFVGRRLSSVRQYIFYTDKNFRRINQLEALSYDIQTERENAGDLITPDYVETRTYYKKINTSCEVK